MCDEKDCKHEKRQPVTLTARDLKIGKALFATLTMRYYSEHETPQDLADGLFTAGACMTGCKNPECPHNMVFMQALVQAIDHVDNGARLAAYEAYNEFLEDARPKTLGSLLERLFGRVRAPRLPDMGAIVDTVIVDDKAGIVFDATPELDDDGQPSLMALSLLPPDGILH